jgi:hypothetical protein
MDEEIYAQRVSNDGSLLWGAQGLLVASGVGYQQYAKPAPDGSGGVVLAWEDNRSGVTQIYGQRVSADGTTLWTTNGINISNLAHIVICCWNVPDGLGGFFIIYGGTGNVYCQHVSSNGTLMWNPAYMVDTEKSNAPSGKIALDGQGGVILTWLDNDLVTGYDTCYVQRLNANGVPLWGTGGLLVANLMTGDVECPRVAGDGAGGGYVIWYNDEEKIYAQHVDAAGMISYVGNGIEVLDSEYFSGANIISDGLGNAIVVGWDHVDNNMYAQKIDTNGTVWPSKTQMTDHGQVSNMQIGTYNATSDGQNGLVMAFSVYDDVEGFDKVNTVRVADDGSLPWGVNGVVVCTNAAANPSCVSIGGCSENYGGAAACWMDYRDAYDAIRMMGVSPDGTLGDPCTLLHTPTPVVTPTNTPVGDTPTPAVIPTTGPAGLGILLLGLGALLGFGLLRSENK